MLLNFILLLTIFSTIIILINLKKPDNIEKYIIPTCKFFISNPTFELNLPIRIASFKVYSKNKDRYFRDFPIGFKFYSNYPFKSKIKINYTLTGDNEVETIYNLDVEFENNAKEYIYYINDVIIGSIDIEIHTNSEYGKPTIEFELLQGSNCHLIEKHKIEIIFPK